MSYSRGSGLGEISCASATSWSVTPAIAETTTTTEFPRFCVSTTRRATLRMRSAPATDVPPYFWTISAIATRVPSTAPARARRRATIANLAHPRLGSARRCAARGGPAEAPPGSARAIRRRAPHRRSRGRRSPHRAGERSFLPDRSPRVSARPRGRGYSATSTKVGLVTATSGATPSPRARPCTKQVLPAPSGPESADHVAAAQQLAERAAEGLGLVGARRADAVFRAHRARSVRCASDCQAAGQARRELAREPALRRGPRSPARPCRYDAQARPRPTPERPRASSAPSSPASTSPDAAGREPRPAGRVDRAARRGAPRSTVRAPFSTTTACARLASARAAAARSAWTAAVCTPSRRAASPGCGVRTRGAARAQRVEARPRTRSARRRRPPRRPAPVSRARARAPRRPALCPSPGPSTSASRASASRRSCASARAAKLAAAGVLEHESTSPRRS